MADLRKGVWPCLTPEMLTQISVYRTWRHHRRWLLQRQQQIPRHRWSGRSSYRCGSRRRHHHFSDGMHMRANSALADTKRNG